MAGEVQEFSTGDVILIETAIEAGSKIVGIRAAYKHENHGEGSSGHITLEVGEEMDIASGTRTSREPIPGPYLEGVVTLQYTVPTE